MYLKRLDLHGFKTFANRTEVDFSEGITAVVGPNGSGKSNVADAVRWVLGEQSLRALRCKRTEDVVFAGGAGRPPAGMAEVTITFDNATGWLDTPFQEVVITRRAHRSGENEYLINRDRVRLRDVTDLLMKANVSPNGYTVIGQGMVELALSLKPDERRELFEDAAGIRHHYLRLNEARTRLSATEANLARVRDIVNEIEPRLKVLDRRARQLREREGVRADLRAHLAAWYGHRTLEQRAAVAIAEQSERDANASLKEARTTAAAAEAEAAAGIARQELLRQRLATIDKARLDLNHHGERLEREIALRAERSAATRQRVIEIKQEVAEIQQRAIADESAVTNARTQINRLDSDHSAIMLEIGAHDAANEARQKRASTLRQRLQEARSVATRLRDAESSLDAELVSITARRDQIQADLARQQDAARRDEDHVQAVRLEIDRHQQALVAFEEQSATAMREIEQLRQTAADARSAQEAISTRLALLMRERATTQGRLDALNDSRDAFPGYYIGVRTVMAAARADKRGNAPVLSGIVGMVASLIRVPPKLETAMETALGGHLQDIVVERWENAEAAVAHLKRTNSGRATFLPLDTIKDRGQRDERSAADGQPGVHGIASTLVSYDAPYRSIVEHLLGRTLIVDDLPVARRVLPTLGGAWQIVTLGGEVVRSSGAITGGAGQGGDRTILAKERERRELPDRLATIVSTIQTAERDLAVERYTQSAADNRLRTLVSEHRGLEEAINRKRHEFNAATHRQERLQREIEWAGETVARASNDLAVLDEHESAIRARLRDVPTTGIEYERHVAALTSSLNELETASRDHAQQLVAIRNNAAVIDGERRAQIRLLAGFEQQRQRIVMEVSGRERRIDELFGAAANLDREAEEFAAAQSALNDQRLALSAESEPLEADLRALREQARLFAAGESAARNRLDELSDAARGTAVTAESARERLASLLREATVDLTDLDADVPEETDAEALATLDSESVDPSADLNDGTPSDDAEAYAIRHLELVANELIYEKLANPESTWRRIEQLRGRLRAIGSVDSNAGREFDETSARHSFLSGQSADLVDGARSLREAIVELETSMRKQFDTTFVAVAAAFKRHFTSLFGGGTARLVMAENEGGGVPGVEIVAQPPGKRAQSLSLLSGGERALTAVAILFAILEVNPTPICILDEVDAALDDANIVRFAETLRGLSKRTQFVVISHNRGTMEAADTLYGISMTDRSTSRTMSLKLADIPA